MNRFKKIILFLCIVAVSTNSCHTKETRKQSQLDVLSSLKSHYASSGDSVAIFQNSFAYNAQEFDFDAIRQSNYFSDLVSSIPEREFNIWESKLKRNTKQVNWAKWGWETSIFITKGQIPPSFSQKASPPPKEELIPLRTIYHFSMPLVGDQYSFVKIGSKSINSWSVNIIILKHTKEDTWEIVGKRNILTT